MIQIAPATLRETPTSPGEILTPADFAATPEAPAPVVTEAPVAPVEAAAETRDAAPVLTALRAVDAANDAAPTAETTAPAETPALQIAAIAGRIFTRGSLPEAANDAAEAFYAQTAPDKIAA